MFPDIYDFFEKKFRKQEKKYNFRSRYRIWKKLKHNLSLIKISLFHSLGFPILIEHLRKDL